MNACGVRDGLSGDMLASSRCNLVFPHGVRMGGRAGGRPVGRAGGGKKFVRAVSQKP